MTILYILYTTLLGLWTYLSIPNCRQGVLDSYMWLIAELCLLGIIVCLAWRKNKQLRYGVIITLMLLSIGSSIAYRMDWQLLRDDSNMKDVFANYHRDVRYMVFAFIVAYVFVRYTKLYERKVLNILCMACLPVALILTRFTSPEQNGSYLFLFKYFHIFGVVLMGLPFVMAYIMSLPEKCYFKGNIKNLSCNLIGLLLYVFLLFVGCGMCNEFGLLLMIALITTVFFFIRCKNGITKLAYSSICLGGAFFVSCVANHVNKRIQIWLNLKEAAENEQLKIQAETVLYLFRNVNCMGWWGKGIGNLPRAIYKTLNTDHVLVTLMNDYGCLFAGLTILLGALLVKWMLKEGKQLSVYERYLNLGCAIIIGFMILIHTASNLGSFITAGIGFPWCSEGSAVNIMLTIFIAIHCGIMAKRSDKL